MALLIVALRALPALSFPIDRDQGTYCAISQGLLHGQQLYRDLWDNKPPGIFFLFALVVKVCGPVMWCVGLVDFLWLLAISYFIFRFTERYLGRAAAVLAALIHAHWHVGSGAWWAAQPEAFLVLFVFAAFFLMDDEQGKPQLRRLVAGILFGAAFWLKYNALAFLPFISLLPSLDTGQLDANPPKLGLKISWPNWLRRLVMPILGFALTVAGVLVYFRLAGSWDALKEVQFEVLPRYAAMAFQHQTNYWVWALSETQSVLGYWTEGATVAVLAIAWRRHELSSVTPVLIGAGLGCLSAAAQVRFHPYTFETALPFFAMIWAYLGVKAFEGFRGLARMCAVRRWWLARVLLWIVFANVVYWPVPLEAGGLWNDYKAFHAWLRDRDLSYSQYMSSHPLSHIPGTVRVIRYLRENSASAGGVFVWGSYPSIYFLTGCEAPSRFISNLGLVSPWAPAAWREELIRDLEKARPRYLVVARNDALPSITYQSWDSEQFLHIYPKLAAFIAGHYEPTEDYKDFVVYKWKVQPAHP